MIDQVLAGFLAVQRDAGLALAAASDVLDLVPLGGDPPQLYLASFACRGLARRANGDVVVAESFTFGISLSDDYLRVVDPVAVLRWVGPADVYQPSILPPFMCIGPIAPGTPLVDLLYRCFEVITWSRVTMDERKALNHEAAAWARAHRDRFPVDTAPLKRRVSRADASALPVHDAASALHTPDLHIEPIVVRR